MIGGEPDSVKRLDPIFSAHRRRRDRRVAKPRDPPSTLSALWATWRRALREDKVHNGIEYGIGRTLRGI